MEKKNLSVPSQEPMPRPERRRRRSKVDRGLPDDAELLRLAETYLNEARRLYPATKSNAAIPKPSEHVLKEMVEDFKERHRGGSIVPSTIGDLQKLVGISKSAGNYLRFSSENSSTTSIIDQMVGCLRKAASEKRLIPWSYIFADYAVTGLDASRQGYTSYKAVLKDRNQFIDTTYIDDFSRASRDEIEWWRLASLSKSLNKRFIGASDGFDLTSQMGEIMVAMFGLLSRLFLKSLREKVRRGMKGAARRGTCLGKQSLGFTRRQKVDSAGNPLVAADGQPIYEPCEDLATIDHRRLMYELYVFENWSRGKIAKHFSKLKVDGWEGWTSAAIKKLLWS